MCRGMQTREELWEWHHMQLNESILRATKLIGMVLQSIFITIFGKNTFLRNAIDALLQIEYIPI